MAYNTIDECKHDVYRNKILKHIVCVDHNENTNAQANLVYCYFDKPCKNKKN